MSTVNELLAASTRSNGKVLISPARAAAMCAQAEPSNVHRLTPEPSATNGAATWRVTARWPWRVPSPLTFGGAPSLNQVIWITGRLAQ